MFEVKFCLKIHDFSLLKKNIENVPFLDVQFTVIEIEYVHLIYSLDGHSISDFDD